MPQLMPLMWIMYIVVFLILMLGMKFVFSGFSCKSDELKSLNIKSSKDLWFW